MIHDQERLQVDTTGREHLAPSVGQALALSPPCQVLGLAQWVWPQHSAVTA